MFSAPRFLLLAASPLPVAHAAGTSLLSPDLSQADPVSYIVAGFNYVAGLIAALVVLVALFGIIKRMASPGSSSAQSEAKNIFWNLAGGFLLFVLAYVFFTQILSPDLGTLRLPKLEALQNTTSGTGGAGPVDNASAVQKLTAAGVNIKPGVSLQGLQEGTLNEILTLEADCGCNITVTSGVEGLHSTGSDFSHANGYKADFHETQTLTNYIESHFTDLHRTRKSDGAPLFQDPATAAVYAHETFPRNPANNHWDMVSQPPKSGTGG